jgi:hypothetical protein
VNPKVAPSGPGSAGKNGQQVTACGTSATEAAAVVGKNENGKQVWTTARRFSYFKDGRPCVDIANWRWVEDVQVNWYFPPSQSGGPYRYWKSTGCYVPRQQDGDWVTCKL